MKIFKILLLTLLLSSGISPAGAVTEKDMEKARVITAQAYLRYANDGSGYLDDVKASSMQELESKLKSQEKENLKAFKAVKVPSDYSSWDKAKLVEFWSATFFSSPSLSDKGKAAKKRVRNRIQDMKLEEPETASPDNSAEPATATSYGNKENNTPATAESAVNTIEKQEENIADSLKIAAEEQDFVEMENVRPKRDEHTWIYVVALILLVGVVVALVVFANRTMKRQAGAIQTRDADNNAPAPTDNRILQKYKQEADDNREIAKQQSVRVKQLENDNSALRAEIARMSSEIESLRVQLQNTTQAAKATALAEAHKPTPRRQPADEMPKVIYLGRVNPRKIFVRADRRISMGNTIYRLDTADNVVGTFKIVENPTICEMILMDPETMLATGCQIINPQDIETAERVETETAGTAIFEDGYWKVLRKARVRFI